MKSRFVKGNRMKPHKRVDWARLDNASRIFPAVRSSKDTKVFRLSCELYEPVVPETLQQALQKTMEGFPLFRSVLRHGVFWYYLEQSEIEPLVTIESKPVCAPIYEGDRRSLLFRVFYFNKRISFEVFHALTDGTGAVAFMESLVYEYLLLRSGEEGGKIPPFHAKAPVSKKMDDSFGKHFVGGGLLKRKGRPAGIRRYNKACRLKGTKTEEKRTRLLEGSMPVSALLNLAHEYGTTLTVFIAAVLIQSICEELPLREKKRPVVLSIPIDLRHFFESVTARNFFSTMYAGYYCRDPKPDLPGIIAAVSEAFQKNLTEEQLTGQLDQLVALGQNPFLRVIPLPLKDFILRIAAQITERKITSALSNLGRIVMPPELTSSIRQFSVCISARRPQITMCSYENRAVISFTSPYRESDIQRNFFRFLSGKGIEIEIAANAGERGLN